MVRRLLQFAIPGSIGILLLVASVATVPQSRDALFGWVLRTWYSPIADWSLEEDIRRQLHKPSGPLTPRELGKIREIGVEGASDLGGLEKCRNLESLFATPVIECSTDLDTSSFHTPTGPWAGVFTVYDWLSSKSPLPAPPTTVADTIEDLEAVSGLTKLRKLTLGPLAEPDLSHLQGLTELRHLSLWGTGFRDLGPLAGMKKLESLFLSEFSSGSAIDLSPLSKLPNLAELQLFGSKLTNLQTLPPLPNLTSLWVDGPQGAPFTPPDPASLPALRELKISGFDLSPSQIAELQADWGPRGILVEIHGEYPAF